MNNQKLRSIIVLNSDTIEKLANHLGITRQSLTNKINGRTYFTQNEMLKIKQRYKMTDEDYIKTFVRE